MHLIWTLLVTERGVGGRTALTNRIVAKVIDGVIIVATSAILPYPLGPLLAFAYSLLGDGMNFGPFKGQSIGKRAVKLQVIHVKTRKPASFKDSILRNAPVGVATFFAIIPIWGWLILGAVGLPL
ncbi:MAG: RDD family protein, partial [Bdellovibrionales bacterium]|nr:RDD family protein [Bdellovibrionales bacterium]